MDVPNRQTPIPGGHARGRVVVGVDRSPGSREALRYALSAAAALGAEVEVVAAYPLPLPWADGVSGLVADPRKLYAVTLEGTREFVDDVVREAAAALPGGTAPAVRIDVAEGPAAALLVQKSRDAELLVVGSRGRGRVRSAVLGSVALHCTTAARCPVVVVRPRVASPDVPPVVVVGVDGSADSRAALTRAIEEARRLGGRVDAVATYEQDDQWTELYSFLAPSLAGLRADVERGLRLLVDDVLAAQAGGESVSVQAVVEEGPASDALTQHSHRAALLVLGSRGVGGVSGLLLGSVAHRCVTSAACPVMVVRPRPGTVASTPPSGKGATATV